MPFARFARMPAEKRERLLGVAAREFGLHGYEAASLNRILEEAGIGKSSAYYYFEDKADLFCVVVENSVARLGLAASLEDIQTLTAENFWATFATAHDQPLLHASEHPWLFAAARAVERLTPESREREPLATLAARLMSGMNAMIQRGQQLGLIRTDLPKDLLVAWFRAIDGASDDWLLARITQSDTQIDQAAILHLARQTVAAIRQALTPLARASEEAP
jgi:AcrR family transcriptional regulator